MFRTNFCLFVLFVSIGPVQAAVVFVEDFEGPPAAGELEVLNWLPNTGAGSNSVGRTSSGTLPTTVAVAPAQNITIYKVVGAGMVDQNMVISADMYVTGIYDSNGGDGQFGIHNSSGALWSDSLFIGPAANPANSGYPGAGGGGWVLYDGLGDTGRNNITDGGGPGLGTRFLGIGSGELTVTLTFNQGADTISVDIAEIGGSSINPTWTMPLTATAKAALQNVDSIALAWSDVHPGDMAEIDNISVVSTIPEPSAFALVCLGGLGVMGRRRRS